MGAKYLVQCHPFKLFDHKFHLLGEPIGKYHKI